MRPSEFDGRRTVSPTNYPPSLARSIFHTNSLSGIAGFDAAKNNGDIAAAERIVDSVVKAGVVNKLRSMLNADAPIYIIPVTQREGASLNMLPVAYAEKLAEELGATIWNNILKVSGKHNTGATANDRTRNIQEFDGDASLPPSAQVIILDDTFTSGDTFTALIDRLAKDGITPVAATTLANGRYQSDLSPTDAQRNMLLAKAGLTEIEFQDEFEYSTGHLTGSEIRAYLHNGGGGKTGILARFPTKRSQNGVSKAGGNTSQQKGSFSTPRFVSQLATQIDKVPARLEVQPAAQWKLWLASNASKLGIKRDEIEWSGINDYLDMRGKAKVSKDEIAEFLSDSGVKVQDVLLGEDGKNNDDYQWGTLNDEHPLGTKFAQYVVPGGENYRELLITLPEKSSASPERAEYERWARKYNGNPNSTAAEQQYERETGRIAPPPRTMTEMNADKALNFQSNHFDQKNILAHLRMDERVDSEGNPTLFIQELQSDWGQKGKKDGFGSNTIYEIKIPGKMFNEVETTRAAADRRAKESGGVVIEKPAPIPGVPSAPFVTDTKAWVALGLKRAIMYAVQNGMTRVAWANGEQNAGHYDLSKSISRVKYEDNSSGGVGMAKMDGDPTAGMLYAYDLDNKEVIAKRVDPNEVEDHIGKDAAEKLFASKPESGNSAGLGVRRRQIRDLDLKVGGEGMKAFYDQIVPQVANDVLKKLGGGKVENIVVSQDHDANSNTEKEWNDTAARAILNRGGEIYVTDSHGNETRIKNEKTLDAEIEDNGEPRGYILGDTQGLSTQQGFTITDAMRSKVSEGVPLFSASRENSSAVNNELKDAIQQWTSKSVATAAPELERARAKRELESALRSQEMSDSSKHLLAYNWFAKAQSYAPPSGAFAEGESASPLAKRLSMNTVEGVAQRLADAIKQSDNDVRVAGFVYSTFDDGSRVEVSTETGGYVAEGAKP